MVELVRTWAFAYRNLIMAKRNVFFIFELTFWPGVAMLSHGLLTRFLHLDARMTAFIELPLSRAAWTSHCFSRLVTVR